MTLGDLRAIADPLAALLIELPQREIGGQLPAWEDLVALTNYARERGIATHLDGARLWECQPFYARPYAEIAALFDTVYVSFYKILGGIAGAVLAGPADVIAEARIWQRRQGGNLVRLFPYLLSARQGLALRLDRMATYHQKAIEVAATLGQFAQIEIVPNPPHTNMMHLFIRGDRERLTAAALELAHETGVWLFGRLAPSQLPDYHKLELTVGDATLDLSSAEIAELFGALFCKAEAEHS
jgi:threonine aldolase